MRKILILVCIMVLCVGCGKKDEIGYKEFDSGTVVTAIVVPTSWNDSQKMQIETTKGIYIVRGILSVTKGETTFIRVGDDGRRFICFETKKYCQRIY